MAPTLAEAVEQAQVLAIQRLVKIMTTSTSDREVRLAAQLILRFQPNRATASTPRATASGRSGPVAVPTPATPGTESPLTTSELEKLHALYPHLSIDHFTNHHTPRQWRELLAHSTAHLNPARLRQAG